MSKVINADAMPEKRLFISLITRDISLADAFLDIIDNSVNAALEPLAGALNNAADYQRLLSTDATPKVEIRVTLRDNEIIIEDNATGIAVSTAQDHVFKFGRPELETTSTDRLSVYGIGLKRAIFKMANIIEMQSDHKDGGFDLHLNVDAWQAEKQVRWGFNIGTRAPAGDQTGTSIKLTELRDEVCRRINDGVFLDQLKKKIARTYTFFLGRIVNISVNGENIEGVPLRIGSNSATDSFEDGGVTCSVAAGIAEVGPSGRYSQDGAGWFVFCNGRNVVFGDKTELTGWTGGPGMPIFQPKHRPFLGVVFFVSSEPEQLPWTTTKTGLNEESRVWQAAKRVMVVVGKQVTSYLDQRYSSDGTEVSIDDVKEAAGAAVSVLASSTASKKQFSKPAKVAPDTVKIQYDALSDQVSAIAKYLRRSSMSGAEVGRYTFEYFYRNKVGTDE